MSLRSGGWRKTIGFAVAAAGVALAGGVSMVLALPAGASSGGGGGQPATGVVYQVSAAQQRATLSYWTPTKMLAAQSQATAQAAQSLVLPPKGIPTAVHFIGVPTTGALFSTAGGRAHFCTASVVNSTLGDLLLTAAHCVYMKGYASNIEYVPEYHNGRLPYGAWPVKTITVARGWVNSHNPDLDFAFLAVATVNGHKIQAVTGGLTLRFTLWYRENIEVIGYNDPDAQPIKCATKSFPFRPGQMEFYCHGYSTGTSGSPWIIGFNARTGTGTVFGVIGGYEMGGTYDWASYSAYFTSQARILFGQAQAPVPAPSPSPTPSKTATATPTPTPTTT